MEGQTLPTYCTYSSLHRNNTLLILSQVKACNNVRRARANKEHHPGDLLYSALVSLDGQHTAIVSESC